MKALNSLNVLSMCINPAAKYETLTSFSIIGSKRVSVHFITVESGSSVSIESRLRAG
jgi:hypothetical protein